MLVCIGANVQGKISASALAVREALIRERALRLGALSGLGVSSGCNRTADMRFNFVVRVCPVVSK